MEVRVFLSLSLLLCRFFREYLIFLCFLSIYYMEPYRTAQYSHPGYFYKPTNTWHLWLKWPLLLYFIRWVGLTRKRRKNKWISILILSFSVWEKPWDWHKMRRLGLPTPSWTTNSSIKSPKIRTDGWASITVPFAPSSSQIKKIVLSLWSLAPWLRRSWQLPPWLN